MNPREAASREIADEIALHWGKMTKQQAAAIIEPILSRHFPDSPGGEPVDVRVVETDVGCWQIDLAVKGVGFVPTMRSIIDWLDKDRAEIAAQSLRAALRTEVTPGDGVRLPVGGSAGSASNASEGSRPSEPGTFGVAEGASMGGDSSEVNAIEADYLARNQKIDAVRSYRDRRGVSLRMAKDVIDAYQAKSPTPTQPICRHCGDHLGGDYAGGWVIWGECAGGCREAPSAFWRGIRRGFVRGSVLGLPLAVIYLILHYAGVLP